MPIFDFKCRGCGESFEAVIGQDDKAVCPKCGGDLLDKQLSAPGHVGVASQGGALQCGKTTPCCGAAQPCAKPGCHK